MVAQVKMHMVPIGRPDLQRLHGVAAIENAVSIFFSLNAYTRYAKEWAEQVGMALFRFSPAGEADPVNGYGAALYERADSEPYRGQFAVRPGFPSCACACVLPLARVFVAYRSSGTQVATFRRRHLRYNYCCAPRRRRASFARANRALGCIRFGHIYSPSVGRWSPFNQLSQHSERVDPSHVGDRGLWNICYSSQPAASDRCWSQLGPMEFLSRRSLFGEPHNVLTMPFFVALIENPAVNGLQCDERRRQCSTIDCFHPLRCPNCENNSVQAVQLRMMRLRVALPAKDHKQR